MFETETHKKNGLFFMYVCVCVFGIATLKVGVCDNFTLDLSNSYNFGGRNPTLMECRYYNNQWILMENDGFIFTILKESMLNLNSNKINVTCKIIAWYDKTSYLNLTFQRLDEVIPLVAIHGPSFWKVMFFLFCFFFLIFV